MPNFAEPWALLLLPPVFGLWWYGMRRPGIAWRHPDLRLLRPSTGNGDQVRRAGAALRCGGIVLAVIALAGPRWPDPGSRLPTEGISLALVVDVSDSMKQRDFLWDTELLTRLEAVQRTFRLFLLGGEGPGGTVLDGRPHDPVALVTFAERPETDCPLTLDHAGLVQVLDAERPRIVTPTNPGDALAWAVERLRDAPTRNKAVVLLTDGESNVQPPALAPLEAARLARAFGIPIFTIEAGNDLDPGGAADAQAAEARIRARRVLQEISERTGGLWLPADDGAALAAACAAIDALHRDAVPTFEYRLWFEAYPWFAAAALGLWSALLILENTRWRSLP